MSKTVLISGARAYQSLGDGGVGLKVVEEVLESGRKKVALQVSLSHFGQTISTKIPVFSSTSLILRAIADELDKLPIQDPIYLNSIRAGLVNADGEFELEYKEGSVKYVRVPEVREDDAGGMITDSDDPQDIDGK